MSIVGSVGHGVVTVLLAGGLLPADEEGTQAGSEASIAGLVAHAADVSPVVDPVPQPGSDASNAGLVAHAADVSPVVASVPFSGPGCVLRFSRSVHSGVGFAGSHVITAV